MLIKYVKPLIMISAVAISMTVNATSITAVSQQINENYNDNPVLANEIKNTSSKSNAILKPGVSYWMVSSIGELSNKQNIIQGIVQIDTNKQDDLSVRLWVHFTHITNGKAQYPIITCTDCAGDLKDKSFMGLPILTAKLNSYYQYRGYALYPLNGKEYYISLWVEPNGKLIKYYGHTSLFGTSNGVWYRISDELAQNCLHWFNEQPYSKPGFSGDASQFKGFAYFDDNLNTAVTNLKKLCTAKQ